MAILAERLLLDSGVWIAADNPEERFTSAARRLIAQSRLDASALDLTLYEVANVIGARGGDIAGASALCRSIVRRPWPSRAY